MALVALPALIETGSVYGGVDGAPALTNYLIDAAGEKAGFVLRAPATGTIAKIGFGVRTVTAAQDLDVRLETVDANGDPSGTLLAAGSNGTQTPTANTWFWTALTSGAAVTRGDDIAISITWAGTAGNLEIAAYWSNIAQMGGPPYADQYTTAWAKQSRMPVIALEYNNGSRPFLRSLPSVTNNLLAFNSGSTPDEIGIRFQVPYKASILGCNIEMNRSSANSCTVRLYDASSNLLASRQIDTDAVGAANSGSVPAWFSSDVDLSINTTYRLTVVPDSTTNIGIREIEVDSAGTLEALPLGANAYRTERTDGGVWTDTNTKFPMIFPVWSRLDDGAGGGGGGGLIIHPGMTGGIRG